jgi:two-component sensor histidine kinase
MVNALDKTSTIFNKDLQARIEHKSFQFTFYLSISAIFLWLIWLIVDYQLLKNAWYHIATFRIILSIGAMITSLLMLKKIIKSALAQYLLYVPALTFLAVLFNCVPEDVLFFYTISGIFMVVLTGFVFFIMPVWRAVFFGIYAIATYFAFHFIFHLHSINTLMINGGILYISMIFFIISFTIVRYKSLTNSIKSELIINFTNNLLKEQQIALEKKNLELERTISDKEILLKELHHRVKNNLQIVSSLLNLSDPNDQSLSELLKSSQNRIHALALLHENIYKSDNFKIIDVGKYIDRLVNDLKNAYSNWNIEMYIKYPGHPVFLEMNIISPLGLILNELITNCIKHAFDTSGLRIITISISMEAGKTKLKIKDNGKGIPDNINLQNPSSLGLKLVRGLINQINASISYRSSDAGTEITIKI